MLTEAHLLFRNARSSFCRPMPLRINRPGTEISLPQRAGAHHTRDPAAHQSALRRSNQTIPCHPPSGFQASGTRQYFTGNALI